MIPVLAVDLGPDNIRVNCLSPGGAYITGQLIVIDGGQLHQGREAARTVAEG